MILNELPAALDVFTPQQAAHALGFAGFLHRQVTLIVAVIVNFALGLAVSKRVIFTV